MAGDAIVTPAPATRFLWPGLLVALTLVRLVVAAHVPLSPDEAYYWVWSKALAPGYLDHPPMVALWIWLGTSLAGDTGLGVRLLAPLSAAIGTVLLVQAGEALRPGAGRPAGVLLNATLMLGAGAVTMTPDTPLLLFWTVALWAAVRIAVGGPGWWWLVVGAAAGLALDSKYTAGLLGIGLVLWLLGPAMRPALRTPWPWLGGVVAVMLFLPVLAWNEAHHWASFVKQGGRTGDFAPERAGRYLLELVGGQLGLATPGVFASMVAGSVAAGRRWRQAGPGLLAAFVLPGVVVFLQHALGDRVQANWVAVLYPGAALAAAWAYAGRWMWPAAGLGFVLTGLLYGQAALAPLPLPRGLDPTLRLAGFEELATEAAGRAGAVPGVRYLASEEYGLAGLLAFDQPMPVVGAEARWSLFALPRPPDAAGLLVLSTRRKEGPDPALWQEAEPVGTLMRRRGAVEIEAYRLYRVVARPGAPAALMPRPARSMTGPAAPG